MIMWMLFPTAEAAVSRTIKMCVDYDVEFSDAPSTAGIDGLGDFWDNNSIDRAGIGLAFELDTDVTTYSGRLNTGGCATLIVQFTQSIGQTFDFRVLSNTRRRGVDILFRFNDDPNDDEAYEWEEATELEYEWTGLPITSQKASTQHDMIVPAQNGWQMLAVATWMIHRSKMNLHVPNTRGCCLGTAANLGGTCTNTSTYGYKRDIDPYLVSQPKLFVMGKEDVGTGADNQKCCGSKILSPTAPPNQSGRISGFEGGVDEQARFTLAHELGHVLVGIRMGGWEWGMYAGGAPLDGCMGTYTADFVHPNTVVDDGDPSLKGLFTKEYTSMAFREGWANFMSSWTWNAKPGADCEFKYFTYHDFDLDGDIDNDFSYPLDYRDGAVDCLGTPELFVADTTDLTDSWPGPDNWLDDALDEGACAPFVGTCAAIMESKNRATLFDWQRMLYHLYKTENLGPATLSNLYVEMCPREWRESDTTVFLVGCLATAGDLPRVRLDIAADHLGIDDKVDDHAHRLDH